MGAHGLTTAVDPQSIPTLASLRHPVMTTTRQCRAVLDRPTPPCPICSRRCDFAGSGTAWDGRSSGHSTSRRHTSHALRHFRNHTRSAWSRASARSNSRSRAGVLSASSRLPPRPATAAARRRPTAAAHGDRTTAQERSSGFANPADDPHVRAGAVFPGRAGLSRAGLAATGLPGQLATELAPTLQTPQG